MLIRLNILTLHYYFGSLRSIVRVRFAPSPTGFLHLGGLRTAFYNYLFAKKNNGKFILRIEDTDQKRIKAGSVENINSMLEWSGLVPDEGPLHHGQYGPYLQSKRLSFYKEKADYLLASGAAYKCFCSETRLEVLRREAVHNRQNFGYDNKCRHLTQPEIDKLLKEGKSFTIRFKIQDESISYNDIVFGNYTHKIDEGDFIILKSDNFPTYHFASVVDDYLMEISHVLRGAEWLTSTSKHIMLYKAFGWKTPYFAHLPLLVNKDKTKLSKRQDSISIDYFKTQGYSPEALLNFLASAGGGFREKQEFDVCDLKTLCSIFNLEEVATHSCILDLPKLETFNQIYLKKYFITENSLMNLVDQLRILLKKTYGQRYELEENNLSDDYIKKILICYKERISRLPELINPEIEYLWTITNINNVTKFLSDLNYEELNSVLKKIILILSKLNDEEFVQKNLLKKLKNLSKEENIIYSDFMRTLRVVLTGQTVGPGVGEILTMLGRERSINKINYVIDNINLKESTNKCTL